MTYRGFSSPLSPPLIRSKSARAKVSSFITSLQQTFFLLCREELLVCRSASGRLIQNSACTYPTVLTVEPQKLGGSKTIYRRRL